MQLVQKNPGIPVPRLRGLIEKETGLKPATVVADLKSLQAGGYIYERKFRVYPR